MHAPINFFVFLYWIFYILRIVFSYLGVSLSITTFDSIFLIVSIVTLSIYIFIKGRASISYTNRIIFTLGMIVVLAYLFPLVWTNKLLHPLLFFIPSFPVLFLLVSLLIYRDKKERYFENAKKFYLIIFSVNSIVSLIQILGTTYGFISLDIFFYNEYLQAIIFPGNGLIQDQLRVPGLFASGGANAYFNSILIIYLLFCKYSKKFTFSMLIAATVALIVIYFSLTRKVWVALFVTGTVSYAANWITSKNKNNVVSYLFKFFILIPVFVSTIYFSFTLSSEDYIFMNFNSLDERLLSWEYYVNFIQSLDLATLWFGSGYLQAFGDQYSANDMAYLIDNVFLALFFYAGLLGVISFSVFWLAIGFFSAKRIKVSRFGFLIWVFFTVVSFTSTFFADISTIMFAMSIFVYTLPMKTNSKNNVLS